MDQGSVVPLEYLYTPHICRWRFVLSGEVKSDKNCDEVVDQAEKKGKYIILTKINKHLCLLSKVKIDKRSKAMNIAIQDKIYEMNFSDFPITGWAEKTGIGAALHALVVGSLKDAIEGREKYPQRYTEYLSNFTKTLEDRYRITVNGLQYFPFDSSIILLSIAISLRIKKSPFGQDGIEHEEEYAPCMTCPFLSFCQVNSEGGIIPKDKIGEIYEIALAAMDLEYRGIEGWYYIYRTALKILRGYRGRVKKIFKEELEKGEGFSYQFPDNKKVIENASKKSKLDDGEKSMLLAILDDMRKSMADSTILNETVVYSNDFITLVKKGMLTTNGISYELDPFPVYPEEDESLKILGVNVKIGRLLKNIEDGD